jgi:hypothetical protein
VDAQCEGFLVAVFSRQDRQGLRMKPAAAEPTECHKQHQSRKSPGGTQPQARQTDHGDAGTEQDISPTREISEKSRGKTSHAGKKRPR